MDASLMFDPGAIELLAFALLSGPVSAAFAPVLGIAAIAALAL